MGVVNSFGLRAGTPHACWKVAEIAFAPQLTSSSAALETFLLLQKFNSNNG